MSSNVLLTELRVDNNQLTTLNVENNSALLELWVQDNQLTYLNIKTLENQLNSFNAQNNSLTCIETLDPDWASATWTENIDDGVTFEVICNSEARTGWYVSTTGSDLSGGGTIESPFSSIQTAINAATDGDTVNVAPGTYYENINFNGKNITVSRSGFFEYDY